MYLHKTFVTFIFTLSTVFLGASLATTDATNNSTLTAYSPRNEYSGRTLGQGQNHSNNHDFLEDELYPRDIVFSITQYNMSSVSSQKKKALPVKHVTCSGLAAGRNITGAVNAFVDWGEAHLVGKRNWHWAGMGGYGEYAIMWICNCGWQKSQPVNCWELNEALRLLEDKCGPGQGGTVRLHRKREIGLGPVRELKDVTENNRAASLCRHRYCYYQHRGALTQCGRRHPQNKKRLGESCRVPDERK